MKLNEAYQIFSNIKSEISKLEDRWGYLPDEFEFNYEDTDEQFRHNTARSITDKLGDIKSMIEWLDKPIRAKGYLHKNSNGRYEIDGIELTSGHPLEAWDNRFEEWIRTRIEHHTDYYIYHLKSQDIQDTLVRIR